MGKEARSAKSMNRKRKSLYKSQFWGVLFVLQLVRDTSYSSAVSSSSSLTTWMQSKSPLLAISHFDCDLHKTAFVSSVFQVWALHAHCTIRDECKEALPSTVCHYPPGKVCLLERTCRKNIKKKCAIQVASRTSFAKAFRNHVSVCEGQL